MLPRMSCLPRKPSMEELIPLYTRAERCASANAVDNKDDPIRTELTKDSGRVPYKRPAASDGVEDAINSQSRVGHGQGSASALADTPRTANGQTCGRASARDTENNKDCR